MEVKVGQSHQIMVSIGIVTKMEKIITKIMTKTKITSQIHQGAQSHQQEAFDHHHMGGQRNFQETQIGKIAGHLVTDQDHVTELQSMKEITRQVEQKSRKIIPQETKFIRPR